MQNDREAGIEEEANQLFDHNHLLMFLRGTVRGLIMKPMMAYLARTFRKHGQDKHLFICYSLIKAWVIVSVFPNWFPNCFYGT